LNNSKCHSCVTPKLIQLSLVGSSDATSWREGIPAESTCFDRDWVSTYVGNISTRYMYISIALHRRRCAVGRAAVASTKASNSSLPGRLAGRVYRAGSDRLRRYYSDGKYSRRTASSISAEIGDSMPADAVRPHALPSPYFQPALRASADLDTSSTLHVRRVFFVHGLSWPFLWRRRR